MFARTARATQAVRQLSTSAAVRDMVKAPVQLFSISGRYASALYSAASKNKALEKVEKELAAFKDAAAKDPKFNAFLANPVLRRQDKIAGITAVAKSQKYSDLTSNLLATLAENNRLKLATAVADDFDTIMRAHRHEVSCTVTSASPLNKNVSKSIESALQKFASKGDVLKVDYKVDPSIRGGLVVNIGDRFLDMSVVRRVRDITQQLRSVSV